LTSAIEGAVGRLGVFSNSSNTPPKISESDNRAEVSRVKGVGDGEGEACSEGNVAALFRAETDFSDPRATPREGIAAKGTSC